MAVGAGSRIRKVRGQRTTRTVLAGAGRVALWVVVGLLLVRGLASISAPASEAQQGPATDVAEDDPATGALAVRYARLYLGGASAKELSALLAPGAGPLASTSELAVAEADVAGIQRLSGGQAIVTVACELEDARTIYLAVPIVREDAGEVAATGAPAVVAGPAGVGEPVDAPRPLAGPGATAISDLVRRFLPAYFSARSPDDLSYLLAPGAQVVPPGYGFEPVGTTSVEQLGDGEGPRRTVLAGVRVRDPLSGDPIDLTYRIEVAEQGRWYVERVEGALS